MVLRRWEYYKIIWFYQMGWQCKLAIVKRFESWRSSVSPSLRRRANARNVSFRISLRWLTYIVNSVDKTKLIVKWTASQCLLRSVSFHHIVWERTRGLESTGDFAVQSILSSSLVMQYTCRFRPLPLSLLAKMIYFSLERKLGLIKLTVTNNWVLVVMFSF